MDIPRIRSLVNTAYKELADMGLNYTATYQDEDETRKRVSKGRAYLLEKDGALIGTVLFSKSQDPGARKIAYVNQLAVADNFKKQGIGSLLMDLCEELAAREDCEIIQLDTAKPAAHLVQWYFKRGYKVVAETQWEGKNYKSFIFEKSL